MGFSRMNEANKKFEDSIAINKAPLRVSCGAEFTLIVTVDANVYACGGCYKGQLGVKGMKDRYAPSLVSTLHGKTVTDVACGREHAFAVVNDGQEVCSLVFFLAASGLGAAILYTRCVGVVVCGCGCGLLTAHIPALSSHIPALSC